MKKFYCLLFLIALSFTQFRKPIFAVYSKYTHYTSNALLSPGPALWDSYRVQYPNIIYEDSTYKMWYSGHNGEYWSVGYATSLDGINWFKYPLNPVLTWDTDISKPKHIITPSVIKDNGIYKMWFTSSFTDYNDYDFTIGYATSLNGLEWTIHNYKQLQPSQSWDIVGLTHPFVLKISSSEYHMYYSARNSQNWNIGRATSIDGVTWTPYLNNPIITSTGKWWEKGSNLGPFVLYSADPKLFRMWYSTESLGQSTSSMAYAESENNNNWIKPDSLNPILSKELTGYFDDRVISDGSINIVGNSILLWYGGKALDSIWRIGLSYYGDSPAPLSTPTSMPTPTTEPTPTSLPTLTPSPSPTPSHLPTPTPLIPIVIVPGMFSSWNKEEILENKNSNNADWKLLGFVKEYDGIIKTLKNLGYKENENLFIWPYDWRQSISDIATQLDIYLSTNVVSKPEIQTINIIGHSLGGLVARTWVQSGQNKDKVNRIITLGSPHQGVIQPYRAWEGGDVSQDNSVLSFGAQVLLQINKKGFQTNREAIQKIFPVLIDLLPSSPYLIRKSDNSEITKSQMTVWNSWQEKLNLASQTIYSIFDAVAGTGIETPNKYLVTKPNTIDFLLGNWTDGKPVGTIHQTGDGTVNESRAIFFDDTSYLLNKNHGDIIASKEGIQKILDILAIDYTSEAIIEGKATTFAPGLLFLLQSPATIVVSHNGQEYRDEEGILFIPNAHEGTYSTTITGTANGEYRLLIGQFGVNTTLWCSIIKPIQLSETHTYAVSFQPANLLPLPITNFSAGDWIIQIDLALQKLEKLMDKQKIRRLRIELALAKRMLERKNYHIFKIQLESLLYSLAITRNNISNEAIQITFDIENLIGNVYQIVFESKPNLFSKNTLLLQQKIIENRIQQLTKKIEKQNSLSTQELLLFARGIDTYGVGKLKMLDQKLSEASYLFHLTQATLLKLR